MVGKTLIIWIIGIS